MIAETKSLMAALHLRHRETAEHCERVAHLALAIGRRIYLWSKVDLFTLQTAALLHDIGKLATPDSILNKPGPLDTREWSDVSQHPTAGGRMLQKLNFDPRVWQAVEQHHEHCDGRGYPYGFKRKDILIEARIIKVADAYDALVSDRVYRKGRSPGEALVEIQRCAGTEFDPEVVAAFLRNLIQLSPEIFPAVSSGTTPQAA